jgi:DNA-binding winged helix-turn-helix (wHTH) protein
MLLPLSVCTIDLRDGTVDRSTNPDRLTPLELRLLRYLAERSGRVVTNDELLRDVWGYADGVVTRTVTATAHRLRQKIEADAGAPDHIRTVWGVGLRFEHAATVPSQGGQTPDLAVQTVMRRLEGLGASDLAERVAHVLAVGRS